MPLNILFITTYNPVLQNTGAHQRTHNIYKALIQLGRVDTIFFNTEKDNIYNTEPNIYAHNINLTSGAISKIKSCLQFYNSNFITLVNNQCYQIYTQKTKEKKYDLIIFRYISTAIMCGIKDYSKIIIDIDDIPWQNYYMMSHNASYSIIKRIYYRYKSWGIKRNSINIMSSCKLYYTSNPNDCITPNGKYLPNIPTIIEAPQYIPIKNSNLLFVGLMGFPPNYQGIEHFLQKIWETISYKYPNAKLYIVGKDCPEYLKQLSNKHPNIHFLGYVENLKEIYRSCSIVISPIYSGAGTNIKVLEALAMKKICIASKFAFKGFESYLTPNKDLFVASSDDEYINLLDKALTNMDSVIPISEHGYSSILKYYTLNNILSTIKDSIKY